MRPEEPIGQEATTTSNSRKSTWAPYSNGVRSTKLEGSEGSKASGFSVTRTSPNEDPHESASACSTFGVGSGALRPTTGVLLRCGGALNV